MATSSAGKGESFWLRRLFSWLNIKTCCGGAIRNFWKSQTLMGHWKDFFFCLNQELSYMKLIVFHCWTTCHKPFSDICKIKRAMAQYKSKLVAFLTENLAIPFLGNFGASLLDYLSRHLKIVCGYIICMERQIFLIEKTFSWLNIKTCCGGESKTFKYVKHLWDIERPFFFASTRTSYTWN